MGCFMNWWLDIWIDTLNKKYLIEIVIIRYVISSIKKMKSYIASIVSESLYNFFLVIKYSFFFSLVSLLDLVCVDGISHNRDWFEFWYMFVDYVQNFRYFVKFRAPIKSKIFSVRNIFESSG